MPGLFLPRSWTLPFTLVQFQTIPLCPSPIPALSAPLHTSLRTHSRTGTLRSPPRDTTHRHRPPPTRPSGGQWGRRAGPGAGTGEKDKDRGRAGGCGHGRGRGKESGSGSAMESPPLPATGPSVSARSPRTRGGRERRCACAAGSAGLFGNVPASRGGAGGSAEEGETVPGR